MALSPQTRYRPGRPSDLLADVARLKAGADAGKPTNGTAMNDSRKKALRQKLERQIGGIGDPAVQAAFDLLLELQGA